MEVSQSAVGGGWLFAPGRRHIRNPAGGLISFGTTCAAMMVLLGRSDFVTYLIFLRHLLFCVARYSPLPSQENSGPQFVVYWLYVTQGQVSSAFGPVFNAWTAQGVENG